MKKVILVLLLVVAVCSLDTLHAQNYRTAVGIRLSSSAAMVNNSVSVKHFINSKTAIEGLLSFSDPLALGALVEFHQPISTAGLQWFYGGGGYISFVKTYNPNKGINETDANFGAQGVV